LLVTEAMYQPTIKKEVDLEIEGLGKLKVPTAFTEYIPSDLAILGRQGFFEHFEIIFREWGKELELRIKPKIHNHTMKE